MTPENNISTSSPLNFASSQAATAVAPSGATLAHKIDVNRELIRYVACLGDHIEPNDKIGLKDTGGKFGGIWVGHSEVEGAPTMQRTNYMIFRGAFTPLELAAIPKKADHRSAEAKDENFLTGRGVPPNTRGYVVYPGEDLNYLQSDRFRPMGVVELTALMGKEWSSNLAITIQMHFFPQWNEWTLNGIKPPVLLSDWELMVQQGINSAFNESVEITGYELLESARLFRQYASNQIEKNRQAILSKRNTDTGGFYIGWAEKVKLFAKQLGQTLEDEGSIAAQAVSADSSALAAEMREDRKLRQEELAAQKEQNKLLMALIGNNIGTPSGGEIEVKTENEVPVLIPIEELTEIERDELLKTNVELGTTEKIDCSETTKSGDPCKAFVQPGHTMCSRHEALANKENGGE